MGRTSRNGLACELCSSQATTYCESDQARLCWHCDSKVHKANFLVSKHSRTLLCHLCQNPTPWTASGPMLPPSLSICVCCASANSQADAGTIQSQSLHTQQVDHHSHHDENDGVYDSYDEDEDEDMEDDEEEYSSYSGNDVEEEDDDNQVVPLTSSVASTKVGATHDNSCSSSTEADDDDCDNDDGRISSMLPSSLKRKRQFYMLS